MAGGAYPTIPPVLARWRRWAYGPHGKLNETWRDILERDPEGRTLLICMELIFGQDVSVRVATEDLRVASGYDGSVHVYSAGLFDEPEIAWTYTFGESTASAESVSFEVANKLVRAADIIGGGRVLAGMGEVVLLAPGVDHDERFLLLRGDMDDGVSRGPEDGKVSGSITDPKETGDLALPQWVVDDDRWPDHDDSAAGAAYPIVVSRFDDVPALCVDTAPPSGTVDYLAAYGHGWTVNTTTGVKVNGTTYAAASTLRSWAKVETVDGLGVPVTLIRFTNGTESFDFTESIHVTLTGGSTNGLLDVIRYLAEGFTILSAAGINTALFASAQAKLGAVDVRVCVNASGGGADTTTMGFIEGQLLESFPMVSMAFAQGGYGPIVTDRKSALIAAKLTANVFPLRDFAETDAQETPKRDLFNVFTLRYNYDVLTDTFAGVATRNSANSILCQVSEAEVGTRTHQVIESRWITEPEVAERVVDWLVEHKSLPSEYVEYPAYPWVMFYLQLGDNVEITDSRLGYSSTVATVEKLAYRRGKCTLGLRVWFRYSVLGGGAATASGGAGGQ